MESWNRSKAPSNSPFKYSKKIERYEEAGERRHLFFPHLPHPLEVGEERKGV
jgi:hypothetical protein